MAAAGTDHQTTAPRTLATAILTPRVRRALENQLKTAFSDLDRKLPVVLMETDLHLGRQREQSSLPKLQVAALESARILRMAEAGLIARFLQELEAGLANLHAPRDSRRLEDVTAPSQGLSLVDDSETNEGGVLANIALRSDSRNSLALQLMGYRYGVLAGAPAFDAEHLPLGPHALCHALRNAAHAAELTADVRLLLYKQFEKVVMPHFPALLDTLNAHLAEDGILPYLSFVPVRMRPVTDASAEASRAVDQSGGPVLPTGSGAGKAMPTTAFQKSPQGATQAPTAAGSAKPPMDAFAVLQDLLARRRVLLAKLRPGGNDERVREPLARDEVLDALRRMRSNGAKPGSLTEIRQTLLAQARQMHGHGVALTDADSDSFELFNLFMAQLQREMREGPGNALIERLKLPLVQLGLREHRFFVDATHPARMLLDAVSLAGAQWLGDDDMDAQWLGLLQRAVATVQEDPEAAHDTFVTANHALQGGLLAAARKNEMAERRQVEAARGREKLNLARQRAANEITRLVAGRPLPRFHAVLLDQAWTDVLSLTLLRSGEDSETWRELSDATAAIVEAGTTAGPRTIDAAFVKRLQEVLGQVGYHAEDASAIACQLANGRAEDDDLASRTELIHQLKARARLGGDDAPQKAASPPRTKWEEEAYATLAGLSSACWLDINDPAEERAVRRRLAWVSQRSGHALILNRRGLRVANDDLDSLARRLAAGQLQVIEADTHPAELAWQSILANLTRISGDQSAKEASHG
ncbi:DUF1631 family protein [Thermomonas sp.]|uniref:DUF1631 family protein n=1 Tax=Thermomonas sp. TaxID=1971895 RepID=UPI00248A8507|nr:DUF1631 family protein [Thermomonas sp.]MDI1251732.1 DUF1631 family protein [Thermomonas sp.]